MLNSRTVISSGFQLLEAALREGFCPSSVEPGGGWTSERTQ
jgi:hypothetical protein